MPGESAEFSFNICSWQPGAWSWSLVSLSAETITLGPTWCSHSHLYPDTEIHHSITLSSSKCQNVVSIKYLLVRPQTATWARARWHNTQCSHPLSIPSSTVLYFIVLHCTVLCLPGGTVRSVPILCLCPPSPIIGKYDPTLHTSHQPSSVSSHITPFY